MELIGASYFMIEYTTKSIFPLLKKKIMITNILIWKQIFYQQGNICYIPDYKRTKGRDDLKYRIFKKIKLLNLC